MKTKILLVIGFLVSLVWVAIVSYAAGVRAPWLLAQETQFTKFESSRHENQLKPVDMWDSMMDQITVWVWNHEKRLQVRAQSSSQYPNLTEAQTSFLHLKEIRRTNGNQLTAKMWDDLAAQLTVVANNHEQRLRVQPSQPSTSGTTLGSPALIIENPLDMMFEGNKFGTDYARDLKVKFLNLDGDKTKLRYRPQDRSIILPYWWDEVSEMVPLKNWITSVCVSYNYWWHNLETCTPVIVWSPQWSQPSQQGPSGKWFPNCLIWSSIGMPLVGGDLATSITLIQKNTSPGHYSLDYSIQIQPSSEHRNSVTSSYKYALLSVPSCMAMFTSVPQMLENAFNSSLAGSVYTVEYVWAGKIKIEQRGSDSAIFTRSGSIPLN